MTVQTLTINGLLAKIARMSTIEESDEVHRSMQHIKKQTEPEEYERMRAALSKRLNELATQGENELAETEALMRR